MRNLAKRIAQFRYYGINSDQNYIPGAQLKAEEYLDKFCDGNLFSAYINGVVVQMGIQGEPNTAFYLNDGDYPIYIGQTGIYEINLDGMGQITSIAFAKDTLASYVDGKRLLLDVLYEGTGAN